jgi:hypothetical protein
MLNPEIVVDRVAAKPHANECKADSYTMSCRIDRLVSAGDSVVVRVVDGFAQRS